MPLDKILSLKILGLGVHFTEMSQVISLMDTWIAKKTNCKHIIATGMHGVMEARRNPCFRNIAEMADLFVPDGFSLVLVARLRGINRATRISGPDLMLEACKHSAEVGHRVFFYGDTEETLNDLIKRLAELCPSLNIVGIWSPPFRKLTEEEDADEIKMINNSRPDILWVGLGLPKQEQWIYDHKDNLNVPVVIGVGAAFKFVSGRVRRAPNWIVVEALCGT